MTISKKPAKSAKAQEKAAIASVFGSAAAVDVPAKKGKKNDKPQIEMSEEFEGYVALILVEKALEGVKKQLDKQFKDGEAFEHFDGELIASHKQPETFEGLCGRASAQFQFKKRSAGFNGEIAAMLDEQNIAYDRSEKVPERFTINPQVLEDQALLGKLAVAIKGMGVSYDVIQKQAPVYSYQFNEATLAQVAKIKDDTVRSEILRAISSIAVAQAKIDGADAKGGALEAALEILQEKGILSIGE
jgi:hypothetical protein